MAPASLVKLPGAASATQRTTASVKNPSFTVIHRFAINTRDVVPQSTLLFANGTFYGTTLGEKKKSCGTVFSLTPDPNFTTFSESVLHAFTHGSSDGCHPNGTLVLIGSRLYGTTQTGGASNGGTVFSVALSGGFDTVLYSFLGGTDGLFPTGVIAVADKLYGATTHGGGVNGQGTVFSVPLAGGPDTVLYRFNGNNDGAYPYAGVVNVGNALYGTTAFGPGLSGFGTVYRVPLSGGHMSLLYAFKGTTDGAEPDAALINIGSNLYGTTFGNYPIGTVFRVPLVGGSEFTLHTFGTGTDGAGPVAALTLVGSELYGTTAYGGTAGDGTVYKVSLDGSSESVLHSFTGNAAGSTPEGAITYAHGSLFGTTKFGIGEEKYVSGTIFEL